MEYYQKIKQYFQVALVQAQNHNTLLIKYFCIKVSGLLVFFLGILSFNGFTQSDSLSLIDSAEYADRKLKFGFDLGANYSQIDFSGRDVSTDNGMGFRMGILANYEFTSFLSLSPRLDMSFNTGNVTFPNIDQSEEAFRTNPIHYELMVTSL